MNNQLLRSCGIQPEILAKFKEIFPEHADIEEFINTRATRNDNGPRHASIADGDHTASLEQAQIREALATSFFQAQTLPVPSNNAPEQISHSRNLSSHGSRNNSTDSELAAAIALSLEAPRVESIVPAAESQGAPSAGSSLPEAIRENVDPDNMTYEELQNLGDALGPASRGLPEELIANFPTQKLSDKSGWLSSQKNKPEKCSICMEEYKTGDELLTLPCIHLYHKPCITEWLTQSKTCPVCKMDCSAPPQS